MSEERGIRAFAISGEGGTGKSTLAAMLAERLGWMEYGAGAIFRRYCEENDLDIGAQFGQDEIHDIIDGGMRRALEEGGSIVEGRLAATLAAINDVEGVYTVMLLCDRQVRYQRIYGRDPEKYASIDDVRLETERREAENREVFYSRYGVDYLDPDFYDLVLDNTNLDPLETMAVVLFMARLVDIKEMSEDILGRAIIVFPPQE